MLRYIIVRFSLDFSLLLYSNVQTLRVQNVLPTTPPLREESALCAQLPTLSQAKDVLNVETESSREQKPVMTAML